MDPKQQPLLTTSPPWAMGISQHLSSRYCNSTPQTGWLTRDRNLFLIARETESLRSGHGQILVQAHFLIEKQQSSLCRLMWGKDRALGSLIPSQRRLDFNVQISEEDKHSAITVTTFHKGNGQLANLASQLHGSHLKSFSLNSDKESLFLKRPMKTIS